MSGKVLVLHGPNLNLLGTREPEIYGHETLADIDNALREHAVLEGWELASRQSNHEGELIDAIHAARLDGTVAIIINPAAYTHTSVALRDAVAAITAPVMEVHITNVHAREEFRHTSLLSPVCQGVLCGLGLEGYAAAIRALKG